MQTPSPMTEQLSMKDYPALIASFTSMSEPQRIATLRYLARTDLYFLLRYIIGRADVERQWLFDRCREVQKARMGT